MINIEDLIAYGRKYKCSDIHLTAGLPPMFRRLGEIEKITCPFDGYDSQAMINGLLDGHQREKLSQGEDVDFCYVTKEGFRQRVNIYKSSETLTAAIRILNDTIPSIDGLNLPPVVKELANKQGGLVLVTGATGSGKSTTLAAMIDYINTNKNCHIITIEDPVEYLHSHKQSMIHQREIGKDVASFDSALRSSLREDPDVILVGEMRDLETISAAITAAETGHLVFSTLHTTGAANTIDRMIDVFPSGSQQQIRTQLSGVLRGVISQQLLPLSLQNGRVAVLEILIGTDSVLNLIRENKCHQLLSAMQTGGKEGMQTMNSHLALLVSTGQVDYDLALRRTTNMREFEGYLNEK